jgi:hypothetical protein
MSVEELAASDNEAASPLVAPSDVQPAVEDAPNLALPDFPVREFVPNHTPKSGDFVVVAAARIAADGCIYTLPAGKIVNAASYDLDSLRSQGVQLSPVAP